MIERAQLQTDGGSRGNPGPAKGGGMIERAQLQTDGGSRGNPGPAGIGFVLLAEGASQPLASGGAYIGTATNNQAEYQALIWGLKNALALDVKTIDIACDSELLVRQLQGVYRVKNAGIQPLYREAVQLLGEFAEYTVKHVYREHNKQADAMANRAMDVRQTVGDYSLDYQIKTEEENLSEDICNKPADASSKESTKAARSIYTLTVKDHFDAAHALIGYPGECKNLHGHTWDIEVSVSGEKLDEVGILYDFKDLKRDLHNILDNYDHHYLNEVAPFDKINATAENLARVIYEKLEETLPEHISLGEVAVWESPIARLGYSVS
jgi:queuosine biosynthesis protein QueD